MIDAACAGSAWLPSDARLRAPCSGTAPGEGHPSRSRIAHAEAVVRPLLARPAPRARTQAPTSPLAYGGQPRPAGTGAGADSSSGVTADSQRSSSAPCTSRTASTSSRLGAAARSNPAPPGQGRTRKPAPIAVNGSADPVQQRRNHEVVHEHKMPAQGLHRADHSHARRPPAPRSPGTPWSRPRSVAAQSPRSCRESFPRIARIGRADQQPHRIAAVELGLDVLDVTSTPLTTRLLTSPSMTASLHHHPDQTGARSSRTPGTRHQSRSWSSQISPMPGSIRCGVLTIPAPGLRGVGVPAAPMRQIRQPHTLRR